MPLSTAAGKACLTHSQKEEEKSGGRRKHGREGERETYREWPDESFHLSSQSHQSLASPHIFSHQETFSPLLPAVPSPTSVLPRKGAAGGWPAGPGSQCSEFTWQGLSPHSLEDLGPENPTPLGCSAVGHSLPPVRSGGLLHTGNPPSACHLPESPTKPV